MTSIKQKLRNELRDAGWHSRGYLPHFNGDEIPQTVTFRLADSLPLHVIKRWKEELGKNSMESSHSILRKRIECYLDQGCGSCALRNTSVAGMLQDSLLHFDGARYQLSAWVVMPNHVHILLTPNTAWSLSRIMKDVKSFTSHEANRILRQQGQFWMEDYFDRYVRDKKHFVMPSHTSRTIQSRLGYVGSLKTGRSAARGFARRKAQCKCYSLLGPRTSRPH